MQQLRAFLAVGAAVLVVTTARADIILDPGTVTGTSGLTNWVFTSGWVSLSQQSPGTLSGSTAVTGASGATYTLNVQGNQTYQYLSQSFSGNSVSFSMSRILPSPGLLVPANTTLSGSTIPELNLDVPGGTIRVNFQATTDPGASAASTGHFVFANGGSASESYSSYDYTPGSHADLPMASTAGQVTVWGSVYFSLTDTNGDTCTRNENIGYGSLQVTAPGEGTTTVIDQVFDLTGQSCVTGVGTIQGTLTLNQAPLVPATSSVCASGPGSGCASLTSGPFAFTNLPVGSYSVYASQTYGPNNEAGLSLSPNGGQSSVFLNAGDTVVRNFVYDAAAVQGDFTVNGPLAARLINNSSAYAYFGIQPATNDSMAPNYGHSAYNYLASSWSPLTQATRAYSMGLTAGSWRPSYFSAYGSYGTENFYLSLSEPAGNAFDVTAGQTFTLNRTLDTSEGDLVFDVDEHGGPTVTISNPSVSINTYDPNTGQSVYLNAGRYVTQATPVVHVVGPPGQYPFSASAQVTNPDGTSSYVTFPPGQINLGQGANTPCCGPQQVTLLDSSGDPLGITLTFDDITGAGATTATTVTQGPTPPGTFTLMPAFNGATFVSINTTATFTGNILVRMHYDPVALGLTAMTEPLLQLWHYHCDSNGQNCSWSFINGGNNPNPDVVNHDIYGVINGFSIFALLMPSNPQQRPPTMACVGTPLNPAIVSASNACVATIDNTLGLAGTCADSGSGLAACTFNGSSSLSLAPGRHTIELVGTAFDGSTAACTSYIQVVDTSVPSISVTASPTVLWPANHKMVPINLAVSASDSCDAEPVVECTATSSQAANGKGDGNTGLDIEWRGGELFLRAERQGGTDRTYAIACTATDAGGNGAVGSATVTVPQSNSKK